jgi:hypothetical protein
MNSMMDVLDTIDRLYIVTLTHFHQCPFYTSYSYMYYIDLHHV